MPRTPSRRAARRAPASLAILVWVWAPPAGVAQAGPSRPLTHIDRMLADALTAGRSLVALPHPSRREDWSPGGPWGLAGSWPWAPPGEPDAPLRTLAAAPPGESARPAPPARLRFETACVLALVAAHMDVPLRGDVRLPTVHLESRTPLSRFQDAVEPQWGMRPRTFLNAYITARNEIYLIDDGEYYSRLNRLIDDSLAHELVHFVQWRYRGVRLDTHGVEEEALHVQTWFRETHARRDPASVCPPAPGGPPPRPGQPEAR